MARPDKVAKVEEVSRQLTSANATLLTHYRGLSVTQIAELRMRLREANAEMRVVKNTLTRRAAADAGIEGLSEMLVGPTALVFCADDPVAAAKALKAFGKDYPELVVRGGYFDGAVLDETDAIRLADLESREDLLARLAGLMYGALANTARLLQAPLQQQARLFQALVDAGGAQPASAETSEAAPSADADAPAADEDAPAEVAADEPDSDEAGTDAAAGEESRAEEQTPEGDGPVAETPEEDESSS